MSIERIHDWSTPMSEWKRPEMISLTDDGSLYILLGDIGDPTRRVVFLFEDGVQAYRNTNESYLNGLWEKKRGKAGWTFILRPSKWINELAEDPVFESMWNLNKDRLEHYVLATSDDVLEVVSFKPPEIISQ